MIGKLANLQSLVRKINAAHDVQALSTTLADVSACLGFEFHALGQCGRLGSPDTVQFNNYPIQWTERVAARGYLSDDPTILACRVAVGGFLWSDIDRLIALSARHRMIMDDARDAGLGEGFTIPAHIPGECTGYCNFVTKPGEQIDLAILPSAQYLGCLAFQSARRIVKSHLRRESNERKSGVPHLSARQLDCITLAARGKSDTDAGQLLGISNQTVHQHIETAKRRYGVASRTQLIILALFDNQLVFEDII